METRPTPHRQRSSRTVIAAAVALGISGPLAAQGQVDAPRVAGEREASAFLRRYVAAPDHSFAWSRFSSRVVEGLEETVLLVTSLTWKETPWEHYVTILRPADLRRPRAAGLLLTRGTSNASPLKVSDDHWNLVAQSARRLGCVVAAIYPTIPQPLFGRKRTALVAHSFDRFVETGDADWPILFPAVKATARAMDAIEAFLKAEHQQELDGFFLWGTADEEAWSAWLTAGVDPRVRGAAEAQRDRRVLLDDDRA
jgi:PhoPQ-activated pathogenicity-related protein